MCFQLVLAYQVPHHAFKSSATGSIAIACDILVWSFIPEGDATHTSRTPLDAPTYQFALVVTTNLLPLLTGTSHTTTKPTSALYIYNQHHHGRDFLSWSCGCFVRSIGLFTGSSILLCDLVGCVKKLPAESRFISTASHCIASHRIAFHHQSWMTDSSTRHACEDDDERGRKKTPLSQEQHLPTGKSSTHHVPTHDLESHQPLAVSAIMYHIIRLFPSAARPFIILPCHAHAMTSSMSSVCEQQPFHPHHHTRPERTIMDPSWEKSNKTPFLSCQISIIILHRKPGGKPDQ